MKMRCLRTTVVTVSLIAGSLMTACANSGEMYGKGHPNKGTMAGGVRVLSPQAAKDLDPGMGKELALVFAMDKAGNIQAFAKDGSRIETAKFPLPAADIIQMDTITTFQTSNPKSCWLSSGTLRCIFW